MFIIIYVFIWYYYCNNSSKYFTHFCNIAVVYNATSNIVAIVLRYALSGGRHVPPSIAQRLSTAYLSYLVIVASSQHIPPRLLPSDSAALPYVRFVPARTPIQHAARW